MLPALYAPHVGGVEIAVENLCRQFRLLGHHVEIVTTRMPRNLPKHDLVDGVSVTRLPFVLPRPSAKSILTFPVRFLQCLVGLEKVLRSPGFDVVNFHYLSEAALCATLACHRQAVPFVASTHGSDIELTPHRDRVQKWVTRGCLRRAAGITANSKALADSLCKLAGPDAGPRVTIVANGVDTGSFDRHAEEPSGISRPFILGVGRLQPFKGFDVLVRGFALLGGQFHALRLVLAGDGPERPALERLCADYGITDRVKFKGALANREVPPLLSASQFLVVPSRREGFGIAAVEAMACRKAVVAMAVGGLKEVVVDGRTGILVREHTPEALAQAMSLLLTRPELAKTMGECGRRLVESRFTWKTVAERYIPVFRLAIASARGSPCPDAETAGAARQRPRLARRRSLGK
jgi:glycosyltransferase involved in cell wall biosynthesis